MRERIIADSSEVTALAANSSPSVPSVPSRTSLHSSPGRQQHLLLELLLPPGTVFLIAAPRGCRRGGGGRDAELCKMVAGGRARGRAPCSKI